MAQTVWLFSEYSNFLPLLHTDAQSGVEDDAHFNYCDRCDFIFLSLAMGYLQFCPCKFWNKMDRPRIWPHIFQFVVFSFAWKSVVKGLWKWVII